MSCPLRVSCKLPRQTPSAVVGLGYLIFTFRHHQSWCLKPHFIWGHCPDHKLLGHIVLSLAGQKLLHLLLLIPLCCHHPHSQDMLRVETRFHDHSLPCSWNKTEECESASRKAWSGWHLGKVDSYQNLPPSPCLCRHESPYQQLLFLSSDTFECNAKDYNLPLSVSLKGVRGVEKLTVAQSICHCLGIHFFESWGLLQSIVGLLFID